VKAQDLGVPAGLREHREDDRVDRWCVAAKGGQGEGAQRFHSLAQPGRHHLDDLREGSHHCFFDAGHRALRGRAQAHGGGDGFLVVEEQRGEGRTRPQLVAAGHSSCCLDRVSQFPQPVYVTAQGTFTHP